MKLECVLKRWFLLLAGIALGGSGGAKVLTVFGSARLLDAPDPIFGFPFRYLLLGVGVLELTIASRCCCRRSTAVNAMLVAWLASSFLVYRIGLWSIGWHHPCGCLGRLTDILHISPSLADNAMKGLLAYLLAGSYAIVFWHLKQGRGTREGPSAGVIFA